MESVYSLGRQQRSLNRVTLQSILEMLYNFKWLQLITRQLVLMEVFHSLMYQESSELEVLVELLFTTKTLVHRHVQAEVVFLIQRLLPPHVITTSNFSRLVVNSVSK